MSVCEVFVKWSLSFGGISAQMGKVHSNNIGIFKHRIVCIMFYLIVNSITPDGF